MRRPIVAEAEAAIKAVSCLHNFLAQDKVYLPSCYADYEDRNGIVTEGQWRKEAADDSQGQMGDVTRLGSNNYSMKAEEMRTHLANYFLSSAGEVPWQMNVITRGMN